MAEYVYLIWASQTDWYKIGVTTCPQSRLESLQTGTPTPLAFVSIIEVENAVVIEQFLLQKWQSRSADARGEWVKFHPWDMPEVFSDFRVNMDEPVKVPDKKPPAIRHSRSKKSPVVMPEVIHSIFPMAPYSIEDEQAKSLISLAVQSGLSKNQTCQHVFGIPKGGTNRYSRFSRFWDECLSMSAS